MNISQTKRLKPMSVHEYTHKMETYCERKKNHGTIPLNVSHLISELPQTLILFPCICAPDPLQSVQSGCAEF